MQGRKVPLVTPEQLTRFSCQVANLRESYAADANLAAGVDCASSICSAVATRTLASGKNRLPSVFLNVVSHLSYSPVQNPLRILDSIIQEAINNNFVALLVELAEKWHQDIKTAIAEARASASFDDSLEQQYKLAPKAQAVQHIYGGLCANLSRLEAEYATIAPSRLNEAEELRTRVAGTGMLLADTRFRREEMGRGVSAGWPHYSDVWGTDGPNGAEGLGAFTCVPGVGLGPDLS